MTAVIRIGPVKLGTKKKNEKGSLLCFHCGGHFAPKALLLHEVQCLGRWRDKRSQLADTAMFPITPRPPPRPRLLETLTPPQQIEYNQIAQVIHDTFAKLVCACGEHLDSRHDKQDHRKTCDPNQETVHDTVEEEMESSSMDFVAFERCGFSFDRMTSHTSDHHLMACVHCGDEFDPTVLTNHETQCLLKWRVVRDGLPKTLQVLTPRLPSRPDSLSVMSRQQRDAYNEQAAVMHTHFGIGSCDYCGKRFRGKVHLEKHEGECRAGRELVQGAPGGGLSGMLLKTQQSPLLTCVYCNHDFECQSLVPHEAKCRKLWQEDQATLAASVRSQTAPKPPSRPDDLTTLSASQRAKYNRRARQIYNDRSTVECHRCRAKFAFAGSFHAHANSCAPMLSGLHWGPNHERLMPIGDVIEFAGGVVDQLLEEVAGVKVDPPMPNAGAQLATVESMRFSMSPLRGTTQRTYSENNVSPSLEANTKRKFLQSNLASNRASVPARRTVFTVLSTPSPGCETGTSQTTRPSVLRKKVSVVWNRRSTKQEVMSPETKPHAILM